MYSKNFKLGERLLRQIGIIVLFMAGGIYSADMGISSHGLDFGFSGEKHFKFTMSPKVLFSLQNKSLDDDLIFSPGLDIAFRFFNFEKRIFNMGLIAGAKANFNITANAEDQTNFNNYNDDSETGFFDFTFDILSIEPEISITDKYSVYMYLPLASFGLDGFNVGFLNQNYLKAGFRIQLGEKRANKIIHHDKEILDSGKTETKKNVCEVTVSTFDRKNIISLDGESITDNRVIFNLGTGTYTFNEETDNGEVINTKKVKISKLVKEERIRLGGRRTTFYLAPSMVLVSPGIGDLAMGIDPEDIKIQYWGSSEHTTNYNEPEGYAIYVAPGIHFGMLHGKKHYNALTFHLNLGSILFSSYDYDHKKDFSEKQHNSYIGGFFTYMRQWYLNDIVNVAFGPHFGFHFLETVYSYKDGTAIDTSGTNSFGHVETMTNASYKRYEMGGVSFKLGVDIKKMFFATNISLNMGFRDYSFQDYYWDVDSNEWEYINHDRFLNSSKFSLTPEINFMVGTRL